MGIEIARLFGTGDVPLLIAIGAADDRDIRTDRQIADVILAAQRDDLADRPRLSGRFIRRPAAEAGIVDSVQSDPRDQPRTVRPGFPHQAAR